MPTDWLTYAADYIDPPNDGWEPLPHQIPPPGRWFGWLLLGGRGAGKTATCSRYVHDHVHGPPCLPGVPGGHWIGIIAPTLGDGVTSCVNGPSGLRVHDPGCKARTTPGGTMVKWSNGAEGKIFGTNTPEDIERLRSGGNRCLVWAEELAAWRYMDEAWQHMRYGLRVGPHPHWVASTTPKARILIKQLLKDGLDPANREIVLTRATTDDNPHLPENIRNMLFDDYGGTRLGRQELYAEILEDIEGALWRSSDIDPYRIRPELAPRKFDTIVVGVDPATTSVGDEHGIIVAGKLNTFRPQPLPKDLLVGLPPDEEYSHLPHGFIIADYSRQGSPRAWAGEVARAYSDYAANLIIAERNNGGELVKANIHNLDPNLPVEIVWASKGKTKRAEPISNAYQQGRVHHCGVFPKLEDQMTTWDAYDPDPSWSPDRMDAMVWALSFLLQGLGAVRSTAIRDNRFVGRR